MSTAHPPRHRAAGPQGFGRDPHPSGPIPVPAPRRGRAGGVTAPVPRRAPDDDVAVPPRRVPGPGDDAVVRFPAPRRSPEGGDVAVTAPARRRSPEGGDAAVGPLPIRFPPTAPLSVAPVVRWRPPVGLLCALAVFLSVVASIVLVTLRTVPHSLPEPLPTFAPPVGAPAPSPAPALSFGDGTFAVGRAVAPGDYHAPGGPGCRWSRLTSSGSVRASGTGGRVTIRPSDDAVRSVGCGVWTR